MPEFRAAPRRTLAPTGAERMGIVPDGSQIPWYIADMLQPRDYLEYAYGPTEGYLEYAYGPTDPDEEGADE